MYSICCDVRFYTAKPHNSDGLQRRVRSFRMESSNPNENGGSDIFPRRAPHRRRPAGRIKTLSHRDRLICTLFPASSCQYTDSTQYQQAHRRRFGNFDYERQIYAFRMEGMPIRVAQLVPRRRPALVGVAPDR